MDFWRSLSLPRERHVKASNSSVLEHRIKSGYRVYQIILFNERTILKRSSEETTINSWCNSSQSLETRASQSKTAGSHALTTIAETLTQRYPSNKSALIGFYFVLHCSSKITGMCLRKISWPRLTSAFTVPWLKFSIYSPRSCMCLCLTRSSKLASVNRLS